MTALHHGSQRPKSRVVEGPRRACGSGGAGEGCGSSSVLADRAAEVVESSSLPFLTAAALAASRKEEEEEAKEAKEREKHDEYQQQAAAATERARLLLERNKRKRKKRKRKLPKPSSSRIRRCGQVLRLLFFCTLESLYFREVRLHAARRQQTVLRKNIQTTMWKR